MPYYEDQEQVQEQLSLPLYEKTIDKNEKIIYNFSKPLEPIEKSFLDNLTDNKNVFCIKRKMVMMFILM